MLHSADNFLIDQAQDSARHWLKRAVDPVPKPNRSLSDGQINNFNETLRVIHTPGHTPGSIAPLSTNKAMMRPIYLLEIRSCQRRSY